MFNARNSKKQGDIGLGEAIRYFTAQGYTVSIPLSDSQDYDLIVEIYSELKKVQVKTTRYKESGNYKVNIKMAGGNSKKNYIHKRHNELVYDFLFVLTENDGSYLIPKEQIKKDSLTLNGGYQEYKITQG